MSLRENDDIELFLAAQIIRRASWGFDVWKGWARQKSLTERCMLCKLVAFSSSQFHSWISDRCKDEKKYRTLVFSRVCPRILFSTFRGIYISVSYPKSRRSRICLNCVR
jgi:hypothetical protein